MKIGFDIMGGDYAPETTIAGAILAYKDLPPNIKLVLIGDKDIIDFSLNKAGVNPKNFEIVHTSEVISMGESPTKAFNQKPDSSIAVGFKLLKRGKIHAFCSAGNTGAMLVGSIYSAKPIEGILRPCTPTVLPKENGGVGVLIDVGTNPDCKADHLYQFAIVGSLYAKYVQNIKNPKVGLLNIGEEEEKGNLLCKEAFNLMKGSKDFNFIGNVESREIFKDKADVIVCDGFTGNIVLKQTEAIYRLMVKRNILDDFFKRFNYENYGGSPILGVNSTVVIGHGISNAVANKNMIMLAKEVHEARIPLKIKSALSKFVVEKEDNKTKIK